MCGGGIRLLRILCCERSEREVDKIEERARRETKAIMERSPSAGVRGSPAEANEKGLNVCRVLSGLVFISPPA